MFPLLQNWMWVLHTTHISKRKKVHGGKNKYWENNQGRYIARNQIVCYVSKMFAVLSKHTNHRETSLLLGLPIFLKIKPKNRTPLLRPSATNQKSTLLAEKIIFQCEDNDLSSIAAHRRRNWAMHYHIHSWPLYSAWGLLWTEWRQCEGTFLRRRNDMLLLWDINFFFNE